MRISVTEHALERFRQRAYQGEPAGTRQEVWSAIHSAAVTAVGRRRFEVRSGAAHVEIGSFLPRRWDCHADLVAVMARDWTVITVRRS